VKGLAPHSRGSNGAGLADGVVLQGREEGRPTVLGVGRALLRRLEERGGGEKGSDIVLLSGAGFYLHGLLHPRAITSRPGVELTPDDAETVRALTDLWANMTLEQPIVLVPGARVPYYSFLDRRCKRLLLSGLLDEYESVPLAVRRSLGYAQVTAAIQGELRVSEVLPRYQAATRRLATSQLQWFRHHSLLGQPYRHLDVTPYGRPLHDDLGKIDASQRVSYIGTERKAEDLVEQELLAVWGRGEEGGGGGGG
jgi:hypothetical protein